MSQPPFAPVPVSPRHDGWTPERQWRFVEMLAETSSITQAARAAGMTVRSAHRLRRHPQAAAFRAAWDAALHQAWGALERVALDRAINGEYEWTNHDGNRVIDRHKPCSDRLLIYLLGCRERAQTVARIERAEAHERALQQARIDGIAAGTGTPRGKGRNAGASSPALLSDAAAETAALQAFHAAGPHFAAWPRLADGDAAFAIDASGQIPLSPEDSGMRHYAETVKPPPFVREEINWSMR